MSSTAFLLQGGNGGEALNSASGAKTNKSYRWIQMVEDTVFSHIAGNLTTISNLETITHLAGTGIGGNFTSLAVSSGTCIAYNQ
tara:strand:+ start:552 stop:803 length:252 start_codon:yes stop_codon:yes gene_type:complete